MALIAWFVVGLCALVIYELFIRHKHDVKKRISERELNVNRW